MNGLDLLVLGAASWRVASLLVYEDGPFGAFARLRRRTLWGPAVDGISRARQNPLAAILQCLWCTSAWTAMVLYAAWWYIPYAREASYVLAIAAVAVLVEAWTQGARPPE